MHGRLKVRTSEEEKAKKDKERQEKVKVYNAAMEKIRHKRTTQQLDKELLEITAQVLTANPDIYTLWNIRREILLLFMKTNIEEIIKFWDDELTLTEYCLKINPKSYCAWYQREWVLTTRHDPDWKKELMLCEKYLKFDERNFHTWDYRRFVVSQYKPPLKEEFDFTTEKLHENFSNYSAWHYRSKMLVELYPDREAGRPIEDIHHKLELKMVQSAAFTDPDDTSAWFYQRWLLGAVKDTTKVVVVVVAPSKITCAFNRHVDKDHVNSKVVLYINNRPIEGIWYSETNYSHDVLWWFDGNLELPNEADIKFEYDQGVEKQVIPCLKQNDGKFVGKPNVSFQRNYSEPVVEELKKQLDVCRQLLELEPENRWTLLTTTTFLHCIDPKLYHSETIAKLHTLKQLDKLRSGYYNDLITKWNIENMIETRTDYNDDTLKFDFPDKINHLPHLQYFSYFKVVDLSYQNLTSRVLPSLIALQHCKELSLEGNMLTTLKGFPNLRLDQLILKQNKDLEESEIKELVSKVTYCIV